MSLSLLVVDDSSFSRKMVIKALPESWDVEITQAANGVEALNELRKGRGEVMFLDLNMPEIDGYQVLEEVYEKSLPCKVFVLSADIQPKAEERVKALGALAFIKKPFTKQVIAAALVQYEIHGHD